jgi:hypothetical protein
MDLNDYVLARALIRVAKYQKDREVVPEPKFESFVLRYLRDLPVSSNQPRRIGRNGQSQRDVYEAICGSYCSGTSVR